MNRPSVSTKPVKALTETASRVQSGLRLRAHGKSGLKNAVSQIVRIRVNRPSRLDLQGDLSA